MASESDRVSLRAAVVAILEGLALVRRPGGAKSGVKPRQSTLQWLIHISSFRYTQCFDIDHVIASDCSIHTGSGAFTGIRCHLSQRLSSEDDRCEGLQEGHEAECKFAP